MDALTLLALDPEVLPPAAESLADWWTATVEQRTRFATPVDRALAGGIVADRLGFAFAAGYAEALRVLVGDNLPDQITALCASEVGGNHPRAILTTLTPRDDGRHELTGKKTWVSVATLASSLLVVATTGVDASDRPLLRVVKVATTAPGVRLTPTTSPFVPEIPHAEVALERVVVEASDVLPGDGYDDYLKPFRTIEDIHVHAALLGYLLGVARRHAFPHPMIEQLLALAAVTRVIAVADPKSSSTHLTLAGILGLVVRAITDLEHLWEPVNDAEWQRWLRDRPLLRFAGKARTARRERAWSMLCPPARE